MSSRPALECPSAVLCSPILRLVGPGHPVGDSGCFKRFLPHDGSSFAKERIEMTKSIVSRGNAEATSVLRTFIDALRLVNRMIPFRELADRCQYLAGYINTKQPLSRWAGIFLDFAFSIYLAVSQHFNLSVALHFGISIYPMAFQKVRSIKWHLALQNVYLRFSQSPRAWSGPCQGPGDRLVQAVCDLHRMRLRLPHDCRGKRLQFSRHTPRGKCPGLSEPAT